MATEKKQSFLGGAAVLAFGIVAVKIIGAVFKIPLRNILGEGGSADFSNAYNIYATLLTISTAGLPVALSKLVSESYALGRTRQAHRTFRVSLSVFLVLGVASFALMWWGSDLLAGFLNNPRAAYGIRALAPAVVCVGCLSAFRGYAQGRQYMTPTAVSQIIEALCKLMLGLALSMWLLHIGQPDYIAAAGAIAGVTAGTILSLVYMAIDYLRHRPALRRGESCAPDRAILRRLLALAIPITLSSSMVSLITLIDTKLVQGRLQDALGYTLDRCAPPTATTPPAWTFTTCPPRSWSRSPPRSFPPSPPPSRSATAGSPPASCARPCASRRCSPSRWASASGR